MDKLIQNCIGYALTQAIESDIHIGTADNCSEEERKAELKNLVDLYTQAKNYMMEDPTQWKVSTNLLESISKD